MNVQRWEKVETLFHDALTQPPLARATFLEEACEGDEELRVEATSLLEAYLEAGDFIEQPAISHDSHVLLGESLHSLASDIGPYKIVERLGAGGMGEVYLAEDTRLSRRVALKLLPSYFAADDRRVRRFQSEARAASALNHPNILTIYEVGESESGYYIATEYIEGQTVRDLMRQRKLSLEEILKMIEKITSALSAAHAAGIVHRDIKPENIMVRPDGLIKILDFGIAKLLEPETTVEHGNTQTETGVVLGTIQYMSPEQARGLAIDERTDIWSLGVLLYEMLAGSLPFKGATRMDTVVAILDRQPASLSQAANEHFKRAPYLQVVIDRCLAKDVTQRYGKLDDLLADLRKVQSGSVASVSKSRLAWAVLAIIVLLIAAAVMVQYKRQNNPAASTTTQPPKAYSQMSEREKLDFIATEEHRISNMMSRRDAKLKDDAIKVIKEFIDYDLGRSAAMADSFERAQPFVPLVARSFAARKVPIVIGIYLPVIESGYESCAESPNGARGLFQLLPSTANNYGLKREEMCDVDKMTPVAAHYVADRMAELGEDADSVTLVLLSYNRGDESVRETLRQLRETENYRRNFWALYALNQGRGKISHDEGMAYVPNFFAAAIIGENPTVFGFRTPPLTSLAKQ